MNLHDLGWNAAFQTAWTTLEDLTLTPARVCLAQRETLKLWTTDGELDGRLSRALRASRDSLDLPCVGDWVATHVLPRSSALVRKRAGTAAEPQLLAANVDTVMLVSSLNHDFNPRRIERALSMIWQSGALPLLVLSKLDVCSDRSTYLARAKQVARDVPVVCVSAHDGEGLEALAAYLKPATTFALLGSSGVGKSTLLNRLLGETRAATQPIRENDERGRHTTTSRELFILPGGALLMDTPGLRELGLWGSEDGLAAAFDDIATLATACRFGDCQHESEPGCAVRTAIDDGSLEQARLQNFGKLQRELAHETRRHDERAQHEHKAKLRRVYRERAKHVRSHPKR